VHQHFVGHSSMVVAWMKKKQSQEHQQLVMLFCVCHLPNVLQNDTKCVLIKHKNVSCAKVCPILVLDTKHG
jgi:hypothetical protein